jgi:MATE family multidrug resistance protein
MTRSNPARPANAAYGNRAVWRIAAPMILSSATTPLLGMVDTAVVGHLDEPFYLGAVAAGATIFTVLFLGLNFLRMATTGVTAQACGAADGDEARQALGQGLLMAFALAGAMILLQGPIIELALLALAPSAEVAAWTREYFAVRIWSAPASLANLVLVGWLLGMQNARGALALTLVINTVNIVLAVVFVLQLGLKVRGVAFATLLAEVAGFATGLAFVRMQLARLAGYWHGAALLDLARYRRLATINVNLLMRTLSLMFVFAFITAQGARAGDVVLAANAVLMNFQFLTSHALDGITNAAEALVGNAFGAGDRAGLALAVRRTLGWSVAFAGLFSAAYALGGGALIDLLTGIPDIRESARAYLPWMVASPLVSVWCFLYDGVFVGLTRSREMRIVMMSAAALVFLPAWWVARPLGNDGLWLAFLLFMAARGLGMHYWYRRLP